MPTCELCGKDKNIGFIHFYCKHINCFSCINMKSIIQNEHIMYETNMLNKCTTCNEEKKKKDNSLDFINNSQYLSLFNKDDSKNYNILM